MITLNKTKEIEIGGNVCLNIEYLENIETHPPSIEYGHGTHFIDNDIYTYTLTSVVMVIGNSAIEIMGQMDYDMKSEIKKLIDA